MEIHVIVDGENFTYIERLVERNRLNKTVAKTTPLVRVF